jgi:hypothetical protein
MDLKEILSRLQRNEGCFPRKAVEEALANRIEIIPALLQILNEVASEPERFASDKDRMSHIYAMYLLAQFRETRAYPLLVRIFSLPGNLPLDLAGDVVTEDLGTILASVSHGEMSGMASLVENAQANEYVRCAAMDGLVTLVVCGEQSRDKIMAYFKSLFHKLERTPSMAWNGLVSACAGLCPAEVVKEIRQAYEEHLVDPDFIRWKNIERALELGKGAAIRDLRRSHRLITDVEAEMEWWACFREDTRSAGGRKARFIASPRAREKPQPIRPVQPKVGPK